MFNKENLRKVFGFRSQTGWKSTVAVCYLLFCFAFLIIAMVTPPLISCDLKDAIIYRLSCLVIFVWLISPFILLSDTKLRDRLPFFSSHYSMSSLAGMLAATIFFILFFIGVESYHSQSYKDDFQKYINETFDVFYYDGLEDR